jgi:hypothetical protein
MVRLKDDLLGIVPYGVVLLLTFYILPLLISDTGMGMLVLLFVVPLVCFVCSFVYGARRGFGWLFVLVGVLLFVPSVFVFYNSSALVYVFVYGVVLLLGNVFGLLFYMK